jgi:hypothetical protein
MKLEALLERGEADLLRLAEAANRILRDSWVRVSACCVGILASWSSAGSMPAGVLNPHFSSAIHPGRELQPFQHLVSRVLTALAVEREGFGQRRGQLLVERATQLAASPV